MKESNHLYGTFVMLNLQKKGFKETHKNVHEGNKPFKCYICEYERNTNLKEHMESVIEGIKSFI